MSADDLCQCRKCGRVHRHLGEPPAPREELGRALAIANFILDKCDRGDDPDSDIAALSRQFLKVLERLT